jgi:Ca-activated chloride channel family protein
MNDQDWKVLISAYYDGALSPDEAVRARDLLENNEECRAYFAELKKLSMSLHVLKDETLSPDAELKIRNNINKERRMKIDYWKSGATVAAALMVMVLAYNNFKGMTVAERLTPKGKVRVSVPVQVPAGARDASVLPVATDIKPAPEERESKAYPYEPYYQNTYTDSLKGDGYMTTSRKSEMTAGITQNASSYYRGTDGVAGDKRRAAAVTGESLQEVAAMPSVPSIEAKKQDLAMNAVDYARSIAYNGNEIMPFSQYQQYGISNTEEYATIRDNKFLAVLNDPLSTFSVDVDTASYSNLRRFLMQNQLPPKDAVRIEEMVNYFTYNYPQPQAGEPFSVTTDLAVCPWNTGHQLLRVGLRGKTPDAANLSSSNLVFLIDVSGSMDQPDKLPLLKEGFKMMVRNLRAEDKVSIVVYAGSAGQVLAPTSGADKERILSAIDNLRAGGSTAGGAGIRLAYQLAKDQFIKGGNNRVILATDGDFNVGISSTSEMTRLIEEKREDGIFLTVLGFGQGNVKDSRMESLADQGNGNYYYIDNIKEAKKVLVTELGSTLFTIAKDVKIQVEFNPANVKAYRLIGYENRVMAKEDFNDDKKDAGEIGAGHTVTALYEVVPASSEESFGSVDALKYQQAPAAAPAASNEVLTVKLRYKEPDGNVSKLITKPVLKAEVRAEPAGDFAWAAAVAEFGILLRASEYKGSASYDHVLKTARANLGADTFGFRAEFVTLVEAAQTIAPTQQNGQINFKGAGALDQGF